MEQDKEEIERTENNLIEISKGILQDLDTNISSKKTIKVPIAQLATLGAGVSSLIPALRTVTQTTSMNTQGLYRLANQSIGDTLKVAKNGNFWGAFKKADGGSKFLQLKEAGTLNGTSTTVMPIDPATMMMSAALFSIEQQLGNILEMEKQILSFLQMEKESEIEADVDMLTNIIEKYKYNWDNEHFVTSNHKLVIDIQRSARTNLKFYQKQVNDILNSKQLLISQSKVNSTLDNLHKEFKYYRLSLYTYSMASLIEILLSGNFKEENISKSKSEIESFSLDYRELYTQCSVLIEKMSKKSLETNVLKGIGRASNTIGKFIGNIPVIKEGLVDEFLQDSGKHLKSNAKGMEEKVTNIFAEMSDPKTSTFIGKMNDMIQIYNHTSEIFFDENQIYLVTGE